MNGKMKNLQYLFTNPQNEDIFMSIVHVALKLRSDILVQPSYTGFNFTAEDAASYVPGNLFMFLAILCRGQAALDEDVELGDEEKEAKIRLKLLSISQDLMYVASGETKWGPKHVGLGSKLHQITRSKQLVELFHSAGHCLNYRSISCKSTHHWQKTPSNQWIQSQVLSFHLTLSLESLLTSQLTTLISVMPHWMEKIPSMQHNLQPGKEDHHQTYCLMI